jgi:hypothetical protein
MSVLEDQAAPRLATLLDADIQAAMGQVLAELLAAPLSEAQLVHRLERCFSVDRRLAGLNPLEGGQEGREGGQEGAEQEVGGAPGGCGPADC